EDMAVEGGVDKAAQRVVAVPHRIAGEEVGVAVGLAVGEEGLDAELGTQGKEVAVAAWRHAAGGLGGDSPVPEGGLPADEPAEGVVGRGGRVDQPAPRGGLHAVGPGVVEEGGGSG